MKVILEWWRERKFEQYARRLKSPEVLRVCAAIEGLGQIKDDRALQLILPFLWHTDSLLRWCVVNTLLERKEPFDVEPLLSAHSTETDPFLRMWMAVCLAHHGRTEGMETVFDDIALVDAEGKGDWDSAPSITEYISNDLGKKALPYLSKGLAHPNSTARWVAVMTLGEMDSPLAHEMLLLAKNDPDAHIREEVAYYLKKNTG